MTLKDRVEKGVVVLEGGPSLPNGTVVDVQPIADPAAAEALDPEKDRTYTHPA